VSPSSARLAVLTATGVSLIFFGFAFFVHNRLYDKDLQRARATEARLRVDVAKSAQSSVSHGNPGVDAADVALTQQPDVRAPEARTFYEQAELDAFTAAKVRGPFDAIPQARSLVAPTRVTGSYASGAVTVAWDAGAVNQVLASTLARQGSDLRLAFRVYRGLDSQPPELAASVPWGQDSWRDSRLPLGRGRLVYEVWAVLLRETATGEVLVGAERSEPVTVQTPEHFSLALQGGDTDEAQFVVDVDFPSAQGRVISRARKGEEIRAGDLSTGLVVQSIALSSEERLTNQKRLLFTTDGSLVLDPATHEPRTTQTQVLLPVQHLKVVLASADGETRELDKDLP
jgi:hypothetical protein